jgi:hypothetical protein
MPQAGSDADMDPRKMLDLLWKLPLRARGPTAARL